MITRRFEMTKMRELKSELSALLDRAHDARVATSFSLFVSSKEEQVVLHKGASTTKVPTSDETVYDLASLTKIIGTAVAVANSVTQKKIYLDEKPFSFWPEVSVRMLLAHIAGMPAHLKFYEELLLSPTDFLDNERRIFEKIFSLKVHPFGERIYSDLDYMALAYLLRSRLKKPIFEIFQEAWSALGIDDVFSWFPSRMRHAQTTTNVAGTGFCSFRKRPIIHEVHDPNCYVMGGLSTHAGLFGTLSQVKNIGLRFLKAYQQPHTQLDRMLRDFACTGLGFDKPTITGTTRNLTPLAFGHYGFTGTSLWIDPVRDLVIVLLTNRVSCNAKPEGIFWLRLRINQAITNSRVLAQP